MVNHHGPQAVGVPTNLDGRGGVEGRRYDVGTIGHNGQHKHLTRGCHLEPTTCPPTLLTTPAAPYQLTPLGINQLRKWHF